MSNNRTIVISKFGRTQADLDRINNPTGDHSGSSYIVLKPHEVAPAMTKALKAPKPIDFSKVPELPDEESPWELQINNDQKQQNED